MRAKLVKWGDSLAVRLPPELAGPAGLSDGASVDLDVVAGVVHVTLARHAIRWKNFWLGSLPTISTGRSMTGHMVPNPCNGGVGLRQLASQGMSGQVAIRQLTR